MNILYHHSTLADGAEGVHIAAMVKAFRQLGHAVHVVPLVDANGGGGALRADRLSDWRRCLPRWLCELGELGLNVASFAKVWKAARAFRPDMLYVRHTRFNLAPFLVTRLLGIGAILEANSVFSMPGIQEFEPILWRRTCRTIERLTCRLANAVVTVSGPLRDDLVSIGVPPGKITVLPNGVDTELFRSPAPGRRRYRDALGLHDRVLLGYAGNLRSWQGLDFLLRTLAQMPMAAEKLHLLVLGDGPERAALERLVFELGLGPWVSFLGRVTHDEMPAILDAFDIGVLPAERRHHASPMKIIEYMAMGKPVVAPRQRNILELIADDQEGVLFEPENALSLQAALLRLSRDADFRLAMGLRGRAKATNLFTWTSNAVRTMEIYQRIGEHAPRGR